MRPHFLIEQVSKDLIIFMERYTFVAIETVLDDDTISEDEKRELRLFAQFKKLLQDLNGNDQR